MENSKNYEVTLDSVDSISNVSFKETARYMGLIWIVNPHY